MQIANRTVVTIEYTLTDDGGEVLDTSDGREPLKYLHGAGNIIPGLESALEGKQAGDELKIDVAPENAYGERDEELVQDVPRKNFPVEDIAIGMRFHAQGKDSSTMVTVVNVTNDVVRVDANHPLAGETLSFAVKVVDVRDATLEELKHGHVHGPGDHHHHGHDHGHDHDHDHDH